MHKPKIDLAAQQTIERAVAAYRNLRSYSGLIELSTEAPQGVRWGEEPIQAIISYKKPNRAIVVMVNDQGVWQSVADGQEIFFVSPLYKSKYLRRAIRSHDTVLTGAFGQDRLTTLASGWFANLADGSDIMPRLTMDFDTEDQKQFTESILLGEPEQVAGAPVDTVIVTKKYIQSESPEGKLITKRSRFFLSFAREDGLLRRLVIEFAHTEDETPTISTETHTGVVVNPELPDSMFEFRLPVDEAKAVKSAEELVEFPNVAK